MRFNVSLHETLHLASASLAMHICSNNNPSTNERLRLRKQENVKYEQMVYKPGERHLKLHSCWNSFTVKVIKRFLRGLQGISGSPLDSFSEKSKSFLSGSY